MSQLKCYSTGHFFVCYPDAEATFTCYECLEEFATIHVKPLDGSVIGGSKNRRSIYGIPLRQNLPRNYTVDENGNDNGPVDKYGRKRSKPWRCLQTRCKLLACEECSDKLIDPINARGSSSDSSNESVMTATLKSTTRMSQHMEETRAGDSTPHAIEWQKENQNPALAKTDTQIETTIKTEIKTETKTHHHNSERKSGGETGGDIDMLEAESQQSPVTSDESPPKLVYRRATEVGNHALSHFHHRPPGPRIPRAPVGSVDDKEKGKASSRGTPANLPGSNQPSPMKSQQPINVSVSSSYKSGVPVQAEDGGEKGAAIAADSASSEEDDIAQEHEEIMTLPVRSARQAANQAMRNMHLKMREKVARAGVSER